MARDESRDVDRRRAATGLAGALARPAQLLGVGVPSAVAWRMARALRGWGQSRGARVHRVQCCTMNELINEFVCGIRFHAANTVLLFREPDAADIRCSVRRSVTLHT